MKKNVFLIAAMLITFFASAQNPLNEVEVTAPRFADNNYESVNDYFKSNIMYPRESVLYGHKGTEVIQFTVTPEGKVTTISIINSVSPAIDREVIRAINATSGRWEPDSVNGCPVAMEKEVSVTFFLQ